MPSWNFTWIDARGATWAFQNPPKYTIIYQSLIGAYAPPLIPVVEYRPLTPGAYLKYVNTDVRNVELIMLVQGVNAQDLWHNMRRWPYRLSPLRQPIPVAGQPSYPWLQITTPDNVVRNLSCICISDWDLNPSSYYEQSVQIPLRFYASNPYFFDNIQQVFTFNPYTQFPLTTLPILPLQLGKNSTINSEFKIPGAGGTYPVGDVPTYPVFTINGPLSSIGLTNKTTRKTFVMPTINPPLASGETLTIDMNAKTVLRNAGARRPTNLLSQVSITSQFWSLIPSGNTIATSFAVIGGSPPDTRITLSWYPQRMGVA